jgi:hypothetical protein
MPSLELFQSVSFMCLLGVQVISTKCEDMFQFVPACSIYISTVTSSMNARMHNHHLAQNLRLVNPP